MAEIVIEIDAEEAVAYVKEKLGAISDSRARMAVRTAINHTAQKLKKTDERNAKKTFTDKSDLNELEFQKATTANLQAILKDRGSAVPLEHFTVRNGKTVVSALINRNHGYKKMIFNGNKAFINEKFVPDVVFVRTGAARLPIKKIYSLSSPSAHGAPDVFGEDVQAQGLELFMQYLEAEISKIMYAL